MPSGVRKPPHASSNLVTRAPSLVLRCQHRGVRMTMSLHKLSLFNTGWRLRSNERSSEAVGAHKPIPWFRAIASVSSKTERAACNMVSSLSRLPLCLECALKLSNKATQLRANSHKTPGDNSSHTSRQGCGSILFIWKVNTADKSEWWWSAQKCQEKPLEASYLDSSGGSGDCWDVILCCSRRVLNTVRLTLLKNEKVTVLNKTLLDGLIGWSVDILINCSDTICQDVDVMIYWFVGCLPACLQ